MNGQRFDEEKLTSGLQLLAEEMASLNAPPEIEEKLRAAFRAQKRAQKIVRPVWRTRRGYWVAAGIAAVLLIAISVIALRGRVEPQRQITIVEQPKIQEALPKESPVGVEETPKAQEVIAQKPRRRTPRRNANNEVANHVNREITTDFMPLGYLNAATLQDGGQIVRVELPRSALVNFGLPVNMDRYHERVKADVLLGVDGLAHAIRFVK